MARTNSLDSLDIAKVDFNLDQDETAASVPKENMSDIIKSPVLLLNILINCFSWYVISQRVRQPTSFLIQLKINSIDTIAEVLTSHTILLPLPLLSPLLPLLSPYSLPISLPLFHTRHCMYLTKGGRYPTPHISAGSWLPWATMV